MHNHVVLIILQIIVSSFFGDDIVRTLLSNPSYETIVLKSQLPDEKRIDYPTIVKVGNTYKMYYRVINLKSPTWTCVAYAESFDGITWEKPNLGLVDINGNKDNNYISTLYSGFSIEYKDGVYYMLVDRTLHGKDSVDRKMKLLKSDDGIRFSEINTFNVPFFCDSQNQLLWDKSINKFRVYLRSWERDSSYINSNHGSLRRMVSYYEIEYLETLTIVPSTNPLKISGTDQPPSICDELPIVIKNSTAKGFDVYNPSIHKYNDSLYIAYPSHYYHAPNKSRGGEYDNDGYATIGFWKSNNGKDFELVEDDYITDENRWLEFGIGHIQTDTTVIHYYIKFDSSHAANNGPNAIIARVHTLRNKDNKTLN